MRLHQIYNISECRAIPPGKSILMKLHRIGCGADESEKLVYAVGENYDKMKESISKV